jgi:hypothetical protein
MAWVLLMGEAGRFQFRASGHSVRPTERQRRCRT